MEFGILGPLLVRDDGRVHTVAAAKQRVLLAALLLRQGQLTPAESLADTIWNGCPPPSAATTLRNYVMRLRRALGGAGERIETGAGGYLIHVGSDEYDARRFALLHEEGAAELRSGEYVRAAHLLDEALGLWRGSVLEDVPSDALRSAEAGLLAEARLDVLEARMEADLRLGRHAEAAAELRALTAAHPERERFSAQLMTVLHLLGRRAEALAAYRRVRRSLVEDIGVEPGAELREVHQQILCADTAPSGSAPAYPAAPGRPAAPVPAPRQLPPVPIGFTGRGVQAGRLVERLTAAPGPAPFVAVLTGQPGVGKSALARQVAHRVQRTFSDGILYADLGGTSAGPVPPDEVLAGFLHALGVAADAVPDGTEARTSLYRSLMVGRRTLVVLDDARDSAQVRPLLPSDPAGAALVTGRHRLADLVEAEPVELDVMTAAEAEFLFERLVGPARAGVDPAAVAEVAAACEGLPLALQVCAARLSARSAWSVRHLADRLRDGHRLLDELRVGDLDVRASIARSHGELAPAAARAFRLLSRVEAPVFGTELAGRVLDEPPGRAEELLELLVDRHLLVSRGPGRYAYAGLLRAFAREQCLVRDTVRATVPQQRRGGPAVSGSRSRGSGALPGRAVGFGHP